MIANTTAPYPAAVTALGTAGLTTVTKTVGTPSPNPASIVTREFERDLNAYLGGTSGGAGSLQGIINYNAAHPVEGLKYQQRDLTGRAVAEPDDVRVGPGGRQGLERRGDRRAADRHGRDHGPVRQRAGGDRRPRRLPGPDRARRLRHGRLGPQPDRRGVRRRRAGGEAKLLAAGNAFEQAANVRLAPSWTNPSMFRCVPGSTFFSPHHCHPGDLQSATAMGALEFPVQGDVGAAVPATLSLTLGTPAGVRGVHAGLCEDVQRLDGRQRDLHRG